MNRTLRWVLPLLVMAAVGGGSPAAAQELDEDGLLVAEEMLLEEATGGELQTEEDVPVAEEEEEAAGESEDDVWLEDLLLDEEPMEEAVPDPEEAAAAGVEELAGEALGDEAQMPPIEEPVDEDTVLDEPVAEEMAEPSLEDLLLGDQESVPEEPTTGEPVLEVAEEKGVEDVESVEELAAEALGETGEAAAPVETGAVDEAAAPEEDVFAELMGGEAVAEEAPAEEPMAGELPAEAPAEVPEEAPAELAEPDLDDLLAEEPALEEAAPAMDEPVPEEPVLEEPVMEDVLAEEPAVEEAAPDEPAAEDPMTLEDDLLDELLADEEPLREEPMAEEPVAEEAPAEEPPAEEPMVEAPFAEAPASEEPAAEEPPVAQMPEIEEPVAEAPLAEVPPAPRPGPAVGVQEGPIDMLREAEALKRRAFQNHAEETLKSAEEALRGRRYQEARTFFENALDTLKRLGRRAQDKPLRERANRGLAEALYRRAEVLRRQKEMEDALQTAKLASQAGHPKAPDLVRRINEETAKPPPPAPEQPPPRWRQEEYLKAEADIAEQLKAGRQYYMSEEYERAQAMFESILAKDPYNTEAIRMLEKTGQARHDIATMEIEATRRNMMAQLRETWNPRDYDVEQIQIPLGPEDGAPRLDIGQAERQAIRDKMEGITIPQIEFRQANIQDVIAFLQEASRDYDQEAAEGERRGVNIILNLQRADQAPAEPTRPADPFADTLGGGGGADTTASGIPLITFSARQISLLEALKIVTDVSGLKYRIDRNVVMVLPIDAPEGRIVTRMYDVLPTVEERIGQVGRALTGGRGGMGAGGAVLGGGGFDFAEEQAGGGEGVDWKAAFREMGVSWPNGSSVKYVRAMGKLVVANTEENLVDFEEILAELNVLPSQIEIEARFVEVSQTDLDSLGFEWLLTDNWEIAQRRGQGGTALSGRQRIVMQANAASGGFTTGNRFVRDLSSGAGESSVTDDLLSIASVLTNPELTMVLHALQQTGNTDLLSAPKIVTQSGSEATIKVVTEYVYPTDYEVRTESTGGGRDETGRGGGVRGFVEPSGFETREVGVILTVLPEVSPEGQMINLTMNPEVVSEPIWRDYGTVYTDENGNEQELRMEQPFFFTRSIATTISIYNGATVVMGGMITETRNTVDDRIPLLGSIPVVGRLFRSSYDSSEKRNLLIFVTARLVDPAGRPLKRAERGDMRAPANEPAT